MLSQMLHQTLGHLAIPPCIVCYATSCRTLEYSIRRHLRWVDLSKDYNQIIIYHQYQTISLSIIFVGFTVD